MTICESDAAGLLTNVILKAVTGQTATFVEHYEYYEQSMLVGVCGYAPFDMTTGGKVSCKCAGWGGFTGLYMTHPLKTGTITVTRLFSDKGTLKLMLLKAEASNPPKWCELGWADPMPDFPSIMMTPDCPMDFYIETVPAQHVNIVYGDHRAQIRDFCKFTGIEVVEYRK